MQLSVNDLTYLPAFDCFAKVIDIVTLIDNQKAYKVENKHENINNMLLRESEVYGTIRYK